MSTHFIFSDIISYGSTDYRWSNEPTISLENQVINDSQCQGLKASAAVNFLAMYSVIGRTFISGEFWEGLNLCSIGQLRAVPRLFPKQSSFMIRS